MIYSNLPHFFSTTQSGSRPRSGWCCLLPSLSRTGLSIFHYTSCLVVVWGPAFFAPIGLCGANIFYCIISCFPFKILSIFPLRCTNVNLCIPIDSSRNIFWTLSVILPAERLSGTSYYCSHHLLHPTGPPSWRPAPTSLFFLHLSEETKREKPMRPRHNPKKQNRDREEMKIKVFRGRKQLYPLLGLFNIRIRLRLNLHFLCSVLIFSAWSPLEWDE